MKKYAGLLPLFIVQFFTWVGMFSLWIYTVPTISKTIFGSANPAEAMEDAAKWAGLYFALYSLLGATLVFLLHRILKSAEKYLVHSVALFCGAAGLMSIYFIHSASLLILSFVLVGVAWSAVSTIPYLLVGELAPEGNSENYYSVFNFSTVIPQAVAAFLLASFTKDLFAGDTSKTIFTGGIFMLLAAFTSLFFYFKNKKLTPFQQIS